MVGGVMLIVCESGEHHRSSIHTRALGAVYRQARQVEEAAEAARIAALLPLGRIVPLGGGGGGGGAGREVVSGVLAARFSQVRSQHSSQLINPAALVPEIIAMTMWVHVQRPWVVLQPGFAWSS